MNDNKLPPRGTGPFYGASQFTINQANMVENHWQQVVAGPELDPVFDILKAELSIGAVHNSGERYDAPKCHPGTREKVLGEIMSWINSENPESRAMWLRGPAGAGKSAIAQTTAEQCFKEGKLLGSFFFARFDSERNRPERLIPTIAYQLAMYIPEAKQHLLDVLHVEGQALLRLSLDWQIQRLLLDPIKKVFAQGSTTSPKCIIIDGLDECQDAKKQAEIIRCVLKAASVLATVGCPIFLLVVSRPELEIRQAFKKEKQNDKFHVLDLNKTYDPEKDIDWFLRDKFDEIKTNHPSCRRLESSWPSNEQIDHILQKSSGHFIYAATVIRYVGNMRSNPAKSLDEITRISCDSGIISPFAELDALYTYILNGAVAQSGQIYPKLISIFEALLCLRHTKFPDLIDEFLGLGGDIEILLGDLHSIIFMPDDLARGEIKFHHASFGDFLQDKRRSGTFFVDKALAHLRLSSCCVKCLRTYVRDETHDKTFSKAFQPAIREYFHHVNKWLQLDPSMGLIDKADVNDDDIAIVCEAAITTKYAAVGLQMDVKKHSILGTFPRIIMSGGDDPKMAQRYHWVFKAMKTRPCDFSVGTYLDSGSGNWNHIEIRHLEDASLSFFLRQIRVILQGPLFLKMKTIGGRVDSNSTLTLMNIPANVTRLHEDFVSFDVCSTKLDLFDRILTGLNVELDGIVFGSESIEQLSIIKSSSPSWDPDALEASNGIKRSRGLRCIEISCDWDSDGTTSRNLNMLLRAAMSNVALVEWFKIYASTSKVQPTQKWLTIIFKRLPGPTVYELTDIFYLRIVFSTSMSSVRVYLIDIKIPQPNYFTRIYTA